MIINFTILIIFILLNGIFTGAELAFNRYSAMPADDDERDTLLKKNARVIAENINDFNMLFYSGIAIFTLGAGWFGHKILPALNFLNEENYPALGEFKTFFLFIIFAIIYSFFGIIIPRAIANLNPEASALRLALPFRALGLLLTPVNWLLHGMGYITKIIFRLDLKKNLEENPTQEELKHYIEESGEIEEDARRLLENVFDFGETTARSIMTPRNRISAVEENSTLEEVLETINEDGYSRMPVYSETLDSISGIVNARDLLKFIMSDEKFDLAEITREAFSVGEDTEIDDVLKELQKRRQHMAIVVDRFGGTAGLLTMEDILEELVGEIQDEYDEETPIVVNLADNTFRVQAHANIGELNDLLPAEIPEDEDYETIGGMIISEIGRIPDAGETFEMHGYEIKILSREQRHLELIEMMFSGEIEED
jgi:CBS domain containing-hemolysin-like protein